MNTIMTKTEYLDFVRNWKAEYKELSNEIRRTKEERRVSSEPEQGILNSRRERMRKIARQMLHQRAEMKVKAQEAYLAEKEKNNVG